MAVIEGKYFFKLNPAYCLYNGVAVVKQEGATIIFLIENTDDELLQERLKRAFSNFLNFVLRQDDCTEEFRRIPNVVFKKGDRDDLRQIISKMYGDNGLGVHDVNNLIDVKSEKNIEAERRKNEAAAVLLLDGILMEARMKKATDIHIEGNVVKLRINGLLEKSMEINGQRTGELIQRIKLLAGMNSLEKRRSQDGHFVYGDEKPIFVRVSSVSIINNKYESNESVVLRLLDTSRTPLSIGFLGFNQLQIEKIDELCQLKNGLVLVCGATGSGKSTTVASILVEIEKKNFGKLKIISLEDPPEYIIPGVSQLKIDREIDNSFKNSLDYIFRQDPDVIMIGEIRDEISAEAAIRAALTGHLVFATIHTGSPGESILRLENFGIGRKVLTSVLKSVIMQELCYIGDKVSLYADIAIPTSDFSWFVNDDMGALEINEYYNHFTNYGETLTKNIREMGKLKQLNPKNWQGGKYGGKTHKHIV